MRGIVRALPPWRPRRNALARDVVSPSTLANSECSTALAGLPSGLSPRAVRHLVPRSVTFLRHRGTRLPLFLLRSTQAAVLGLRLGSQHPPYSRPPAPLPRP